MVKSPKIQHSKTGARPVTIDLSAEDVSRIPADQPRPEGVSDAATAKPADTGDRKPDAGASPAPTSDKTAASSAVPPVGGSSHVSGAADTQKQAEPQKPRTDQPKPESRPASGAGGAAFGRDATSKPSAPPPPRPDAPPRRGAGSTVAAGLLGGAVVLAAAAGAWYAGLVPPTQQVPAASRSAESEALRTEIDGLKSEIAELRNAPVPQGGDATGLADANARIESVSVLVEEMRAQLSQLAEGTAGGTGGIDPAALDELRAALSAMEQRVAALPAEGGGAEALRAEMTRVGESVNTAVQSAASATEAASAAQSRIDGLEQRLIELAARVEEQDKTPGVALAIAASALKAAIDRGTAFTTELETYAGLAPEAPELAALREMAASGVPTRAAIAAETDAVATRMIEAGRVVDPNAGLLDRLWASAQSLVTVRPVGEVEGSDVPAVVARWEAALDAGDYERAVAEYETLPADAKTAGAALMNKVRARQTADGLIEQALSAALRA